MVTPRYLLDTNILSEPLKPHPHPAVIEKLQRHRHEIAIATVVWHELWFGCYRLPMSQKRQRIEHYLNVVVLPYIPILPYNQAAAEWHAAERARLMSLGQSPPFVDGQIAAIANAHDVIVVTRNDKDFERFTGLIVENWFLPDSQDTCHDDEQCDKNREGESSLRESLRADNDTANKEPER